MDKIRVYSQVKLLLTDGCAETKLFKNLKNFKEEWKQILTKFPPIAYDFKSS